MRRWLLVLAVLYLVGKVHGAGEPFVPQSATEAQVADLARSAGFPEPTIARAVAVAKCESSLRPDAKGDGHLVDVEWGPSIGIWQIRSRWADLGTGRPRDPSRLTDPAFNARAAYALSAGGADWSAWSCR
jgi:hypothetical protein